MGPTSVAHFCWPSHMMAQLVLGMTPNSMVRPTRHRACWARLSRCTSMTKTALAWTTGWVLQSCIWLTWWTTRSTTARMAGRSRCGSLLEARSSCGCGSSSAARRGRTRSESSRTLCSSHSTSRTLARCSCGATSQRCAARHRPLRPTWPPRESQPRATLRVERPLTPSATLQPAGAGQDRAGCGEGHSRSGPRRVLRPVCPPVARRADPHLHRPLPYACDSPG